MCDLDLDIQTYLDIVKMYHKTKVKFLRHLIQNLIWKFGFAQKKKKKEKKWFREKKISENCLHLFYCKNVTLLNLSNSLQI